MDVIVNELEIILEPEAVEPQSGRQTRAPEKPSIGAQEIVAVLDREQRNRLRLMAH